jgi:DNA polymerase III epsilon subunit-like protein
MFEGFYVLDCECTGLDAYKHDVIEVSILRLSDGEQRTWCLKPTNIETISSDALRVNGHKYEDITHQTKYGKETYLDPKRVIVEIENWTLEDNLSEKDHFLIGQNISFDRNMLEQLWTKCNAIDSFPFGRRYLDTMQFEILMDLAKGTKSESYSLNSIIKKYGIKNEKAHTAAADVKATKEVFIKQLDYLKSILKNKIVE